MCAFINTVRSVVSDKMSRSGNPDFNNVFNNVSKPKHPQKFKHLALYFHFLGGHGRQGRHRTTPLPSNWVIKTLLKSGALLRDILSDTTERTVQICRTRVRLQGGTTLFTNF